MYVLDSALLQLAAKVEPFQGRRSPNFFQGIFLYCYRVILVVLNKGVNFDPRDIFLYDFAAT